MPCLFGNLLRDLGCQGSERFWAACHICNVNDRRICGHIHQPERVASCASSWRVSGMRDALQGGVK